jgi:hypothetical protein
MFYNDNQKMSVNGLYASINTPEALKGEEVHQLPPYSPCLAHIVDEFECPDNWMHGSDKSSSYFVPVKAGKGLWFDFTQNEYHSHHIAVVISVQGVNPINGQKTDALNLQQYKNKCPVHDVDFQQNRFCPECEYEWPAQNYLSTTTRQMLWLDGFRGENGKVRQYIITEEEIRGVAAQMIGNDRVFAIGFAFYLSKEPKPVTPVQECYSGWSGSPAISGWNPGYTYTWPCLTGYTWNGKAWDAPPPPLNPTPTYGRRCSILRAISCSTMPQNINIFHASNGSVCGGGGMSSSLGPMGATGPQGFQGSPGYFKCAAPVPSEVKCWDNQEIDYDEDIATFKRISIPLKEKKEDKKETKLEIGAGARIQQEIGIDPESIDFWQEEPAGMIYVNYVTEEKANAIIANGKRKHKKDTFLEGLTVGN